MLSSMVSRIATVCTCVSGMRPSTMGNRHVPGWRRPPGVRLHPNAAPVFLARPGEVDKQLDACILQRSDLLQGRRLVRIPRALAGRQLARPDPTAFVDRSFHGPLLFYRTVAKRRPPPAWRTRPSGRYAPDGAERKLPGRGIHVAAIYLAMYPCLLFSSLSPDSVRVLLLSLLHGPHNSILFDIWLMPPSDRGVLWSSSRYRSSSNSLSQPAHFGPCRLIRISFISFRLICGPFGSSTRRRVLRKGTASLPPSVRSGGKWRILSDRTRAGFARSRSLHYGRGDPQEDLLVGGGE